MKISPLTTISNINRIGCNINFAKKKKDKNHKNSINIAQNPKSDIFTKTQTAQIKESQELDPWQTRGKIEYEKAIRHKNKAEVYLKKGLKDGLSDFDTQTKTIKFEKKDFMNGIMSECNKDTQKVLTQTHFNLATNEIKSIKDIEGNQQTEYQYFNEVPLTVIKSNAGGCVIETEKFTFAPDGTLRRYVVQKTIKNTKVEILDNFYTRQGELVSELKTSQTT